MPEIRGQQSIQVLCAVLPSHMRKGVAEFKEVWRKPSEIFKMVKQLPCAETFRGWDTSFEEERSEE